MNMQLINEVLHFGMLAGVFSFLGVAVYRLYQSHMRFEQEIKLIEEMVDSFRSGELLPCRCIVAGQANNATSVTVRKTHCSSVSRSNLRFIVMPIGAAVDKELQFQRSPHQGVFDCNSCRHKFACLLKIDEPVTYEPVSSQAELTKERWSNTRMSFDQ